MEQLIAIDAPHFYAGVVLRDDTVIEAAPIVKYMKGWPRSRVHDYCLRKGWTAMDIRQKFTAAIEKTGNPLAPLILQETYASLMRLGPMLAPTANQRHVKELGERIMDSLGSNDELNELAGTPDFIIALSGMLAQSLVAYGRKL